MKKTYRMEDLDCANCARKMEHAVSELPGVKSVNISFLTQKMTIEADDEAFEALMKKVVKLIRKIEPDCRVLEK